MALAVRTNGSLSVNLINASWFNDIRDLLTGVMSDQPVSIANNLTAKKFIANGTLGAANQIADFQQNFGLFSDNTATTFAGATSRLWINAAGATGTQELHLGPRAGATALAGFRVLTNNVVITPNGSGSPGSFQVAGGITLNLDSGNITTDGSGNLTKLGNVTFNGSPVLASLQSGAASGLTVRTWSGSATVVPFSVGGQFNSALSWVDGSGHFHDAAGTVAVIGSHSAGQTIISYGTGAPASLAANEIYIQIA